VLPAGPCGFNQWILKSSAKPIEPARKPFDTAKANGIALIFITGRPDKQRDATVLNLNHAGFRTRPDRDDLLSVQVYKTAERTKVEAEGYTIIANVGDQISDFEGEHSGCTFKVPQPVLFHPLKRFGAVVHPAPEYLCSLTEEARASRAGTKRAQYWCPWPESNQHSLRNSILSRARLPIPPQGLIAAEPELASRSRRNIAGGDCRSTRKLSP
jgi:HAD superfamily, subfamily IIIB (Acid phosphatase)